MQTFLPFSSYVKSAEVLDDKRLGKQRVENLQIMNALLGGSAWGSHPAVKMWYDHEGSLLLYQIAICDEWMRRGFKDTCMGKLATMLFHSETMGSDNEFAPPPWLGDEEFHRSHQSNLVRKNPEHYRQYFPDVPDNLEYIWPEGMRV